MCTDRTIFLFFSPPSFLFLFSEVSTSLSFEERGPGFGVSEKQKCVCERESGTEQRRYEGTQGRRYLIQRTFFLKQTGTLEDGLVKGIHSSFFLLES